MTGCSTLFGREIDQVPQRALAAAVQSRTLPLVLSQSAGDVSIFAWAPPGTAGTVDATVVTDAGTSTTSSADHCTYV
jgi:hypothetical protein